VGRVRISVLFAAMTALCGCGLPNYPTLNPPGTPSVLASDTNSVFTIMSTTENNELEFRGFELFYKFYSNPSAIESNLQSVIWSVLINTYGYRPVCDQTDTFSGYPPSNLHSTKPYPLLYVQPADRGTQFSITVAFPSTATVPPLESPVAVLYNGAPCYSPDDSSAPLSVRRNVGNTTSGTTTYQEGKYFIAGDLGDPATYQSSDRDVQAIWGSISGPAYLAMYVLSYGVQDFTTDLYSTPVYLGYVPVNTNQ
jgi:hypothetical protein